MILLAATGKVLGAEKIGLHSVTSWNIRREKMKTTKLYFDEESGLVLRSEETAAKPDGTYTTKLDMDDYRNVDGMMVRSG